MSANNDDLKNEMMDQYVSIIAKYPELSKVTQVVLDAHENAFKRSAMRSIRYDGGEKHPLAENFDARAEEMKSWKNVPSYMNNDLYSAIQKRASELYDGDNAPMRNSVLQEGVAQRQAEKMRNSSLPYNVVVGVTSGLQDLGYVPIKAGQELGIVDKTIRPTNDVDSRASDIANQNGGSWMGEDWGRRVRGALESGTVALVSAPTGFAGAGLTQAAVSTAQGLDEADAAGLTGARRYSYAGTKGVIDGVADAVLNKVGLGFTGAVKDVARGAIADSLGQAAKHGLIDLGSEVAKEDVTEIAHAVNEMVQGVDPNSFDPEKLYTRLKETTLQSILLGGGAATLRTSASAVDSRQRYQQQREQLRTSDGVVAWAEQNPEAAAAIALKHTPSRKDFESFNLPKMDEKDRAAFAAMVRDSRAGQRDAENTVNTSDDAQTVEVPAPETKEPEKPVVSDETADVPFSAVNEEAVKRLPAASWAPPEETKYQPGLAEWMAQLDALESKKASGVALSAEERSLAGQLEQQISDSFAQKQADHQAEKKSRMDEAAAIMKERIEERKRGRGQKIEEPVMKRQPFEQEADIASRELEGVSLTPENIRDMADKMLPFQKDSVSGLSEGRIGNLRHRVAERARQHVAKTGEKAYYVLSDVKNLGGLNSALGDVEANKVFRQLSDIFKEELNLPDSDAHLFRHGGDEISAVVVNASQEAISSAMKKMSARVQEYVKSAGLSEIVHPKHPDDLTKRGTGLTIKAREIVSNESIEETFARAGKGLEIEKKGKNHGDTPEVKRVGATSPKGQAGRADGGTSTSGRGVRAEASQLTENVRPGRSGGESAAEDGRRSASDVRSEQTNARPVGGAEEAEGRDSSGLAFHRETVRSDSIKVDPARFQFKRNSDPKTGVKEGHRITGRVDPMALGTSILYEDKSGQKWMVSGHHRLDRVRRSGKIEKMPAHILRESEGWTPEKARAKGAEINILEGGGEVDDYAAYFQSSKITHEQAEEQGLLRTEKARQGYSIGTQASQNTYDLFVNGRLSAAQASAIAESAPGKDSVQAAVASHFSRHHEMTLSQLETFARYVSSSAGKKSEASAKGSQQSLFGGSDDSALMERMARESSIAAKNAKDLISEANALKGAAKKPEILAKHGVDVKDPEALQRRMDELASEAEEWKDFWKHTDKLKSIRRELGDSGDVEHETEFEEHPSEGKINRASGLGFPEGVDIPLPAGIKNKALVQAADVVRYIKNAFAIPLRGKATFNKHAAGWYQPDDQVIRLKDIRSITVALHELGHHIDWGLNKRWSKNPPTKEISKELEQLGKDLYGSKVPPGGYRSEGWAEFIREYIVGGDLSKRAPNMSRWFNEEYLPQNQGVAKKIHRLEELVSAFSQQGSDGRVRAFRQPLKQDWSPARIVGRTAAWFQDKWIDINLVLNRKMRESGINPNELKPSENPYMLATAYSMSAGGMAREMALSGTVDMSGKKNGESLKEALEPVASLGDEALEKWKDYAVARRAIDLHKRGVKPGISISDAETVVKEYERPEFKDALNRVTEWSHRVLHLLVESGKISEADFDSIVEANPVYVPFSRQFEDGEIREGKQGSGTGVFAIKGSGREIHDPIDALLRQAEKITSTAMSSDILRSLVRLAAKMKGKSAIGNLITEVPAPMQATTFDVDQIKRGVAAQLANATGSNPRDVFAGIDQALDGMMTVFTKSSEYKGKDNIVSITVGGEKRWFEVSPELYGLISKLNKRENIPGAVGKATRWMVGLQRLGATGLNPSFGLIRNALRDIGTFAITSEYAGSNPLLALRGVVSDIRNDEAAQRYHALGVDLAGWVGQDKSGAKKLASKITATTVGDKALVTAKSPIEALRALFGVTEAGPRLAEFKAALDYAKEHGMNERDSSILAAVAAKDVTVNFSRSGEYARILNEVLLFFNVAVQGLDKFGRTFWKHPARTVLRGGAWMTLPCLLLYGASRDEEWWKELPAFEKWNYAHLRIPGTSVILRMPLPFEFGGIFGSLPVAAIDGKTSFKEALAQVADNMTPSAVPAALSPIVDVWRNKDFADRPIVPAETAKRRLPEDQYTQYTGDVAKWLGKLVGQSPSQIEHLVNGYSGGLYRRVAGMFEHSGDMAYYGEDPANMPVVGTLFTREGTSRVINDFYDRVAELGRLTGSRKASLEESGEYSLALSLQSKLKDEWEKIRIIQNGADSGAEKRAKEKEIREGIEERIREFKKGMSDDFKGKAIGNAAMKLSDEAPDDPDFLREQLTGVNFEDVVEALKKEYRRRGFGTLTYNKNQTLTSFGKRVQRLKEIMGK